MNFLEVSPFLQYLCSLSCCQNFDLLPVLTFSYELFTIFHSPVCSQSTKWKFIAFFSSSTMARGNQRFLDSMYVRVCVCLRLEIFVCIFLAEKRVQKRFVEKFSTLLVAKKAYVFENEAI